MSKFRARQLDATKPIPIYFQEDISDSSEFNNVTNRTVPQLPTGMEKEEETEHHLQQAIFHHRVIPVPEVFNTESENGSISYNKLYPPSYKPPRQMIHIHPFSADQDIPDYDLDSGDEEWLQEHARKGELLPLDSLQFEEMMDRLEKASGLKAVTLQEAKLLLKDDDDLITAVYDYWLNKRLRLQHPLIPQIKSEKGIGSAPTDPYVAFRKRTEKMQTRKNRKNDETSYEKMLKLRRDLMRAVTLLDMVKRREKTKRELLHLNIELCEKRYEMEDFSGAVMNEVTSQRVNQQLHRPAFAPIIPNHQMAGSELDGGGLGTTNLWLKVPPVSRPGKEESKRERRPYKKKRKHIQIPTTPSSTPSTQLPRSYTHPPDPYSIASIYPQPGGSSVGASEDEVASHSEAEEESSLDGYFAFRRKPFIHYFAPRDNYDGTFDNNPLYSCGTNPKTEFYFTSIGTPSEKEIGLARRRIGRGGRVWLDRIRNPLEDIRLKSEGKDTGANGLRASADIVQDFKMDWPHFRPSLTTCVNSSEDSEDAEVDVETVSGVPPSPCLGEGLAPPPSLVEDAGGGGKDSGLPSSFYMTAEVAEGLHEGMFTDLHVTLPPIEDIDVLSVVEDGDEVDVISPSVSGKVTNSQSETVTCANNSSALHNNIDSELTSNDLKGGINIGTKWTLNTDCKNVSSISVSSSQHQHSTSFDFQTQPSSKFFTSDTACHLPLSHTGNKQPLSTSHLVTGDEPLKLGIPPLSSSSKSLSRQIPSPLNMSSIKNLLSDVSSSSSLSIASSSSTTSLSCLASSSSSFSKSASVSSSLATSLSNSLFCASPIVPPTTTLTKGNEDSGSHEDNAKKIGNIPSLYFRSSKDRVQLDSLSSGLLLTNKNNGNNVLNNSNSNLVPQKILSWTNETLASEENTNTVITNGPSSKSLDNLKCAKVTPILFPET